MTSASDKLPAAEFAEYLLEIGGDLLSYGCPTHRLEEVIRVVGRLEGYQAEAFAVPTGLFLSVREEGREPILRMVRVKDWGVDLERLAIVDRIFNDVAEHKVKLGEARRRLHDLADRPPPYPTWLRWAASAGAAGAAAVFFRGGTGEVACAALGGLVLAAVGSFVRRVPSARLLGDFLGASIAAFLAWTVTSFDASLSREVIVLSVVILLVPGMALTTGLSELANKNLVSGAAKVMEAFVVFLSLLLGIALVVGIEHLAGGIRGGTPPREGLSLAWQVPALLVASLAFGVLFFVPRRFLLQAMTAGAIGWIATALGTRYLPGHMAAFLSSLILCLFANAFARITNRPAQIVQVPGIILLVPGSFGFLSLEAFLRGEFLGGAAKAFEMFLIGGALMTGILVANVILPAKKIL